MSWDLNLPVGKQQLRGHDHHSGNLTTSSQALCDLVGNTKPVPEWRNDSGEDLFTKMPEQVQALVRSQAGAGAGAALTVAQTNRETKIPPAPLPRDPLASSPTGSPPCLCATADVAVHLTSVAIIVQLVHGRERWAGVASLWRLWLPGYAGRQEDESAPTCW